IVYVFGRDKRIVRSGTPSEILSDTKFLQENNLVHVHTHTHDGTTHAHPHQHLHHSHTHAGEGQN
ncbi:MAG TPA: hypothetical protein PLV52_00835, partial [Candidatus Omnitrophota bacterium]|nr:hypothetical protein [Candidatus Omnitrophota bacterium]